MVSGINEVAEDSYEIKEIAKFIIFFRKIRKKFKLKKINLDILIL